MPRVLGASALTNGWGHVALYVCAMGGLSVMTVQATYALSEQIWAAATSDTPPAAKDLSRVEKHFAAKAASARRATPTPQRQVIALVRPDIHPAALAAAIDRSELASASEHPDLQTDGDSANNRPSRVAGVACSPNGCAQTITSRQRVVDRPIVEAGAVTGNATADADAASIDLAMSAEAETEADAEAAAKALAKPYRLGKGRNATARQKPQRKVFVQYGDEPVIVKFFMPPTGEPRVRVAETPGDIIRRSLLRDTI